MSTNRQTWQAESLALPQVRSMHAYVPGMQPTGGDWIKLNTNELPYPASPAVAVAVAAEVEKLRLYPNPTSHPLREHIAAMTGLDAAQVFVGNGCDEVLALLTRVFSGAESMACMMQPSYSLYPVLTQIQDAKMIRIPFARDMALPVDAIAACKANLLFLTNPNAPTGVEFEPESIRAAARGFGGVFVIDETYVDFARHNAVGLLAELPNVVITRSLSKSYGLAGLRVGYALASKEIIALLDKVRDSYNVNRLSQAGAMAALKDVEYHDALISRIKATRESFTKALRGRGFFVYPSGGNFVFAEPVDGAGRSGAASADSLYAFLQDNRILVRYFPGDALTEGFLRISMGKPEQMDRLLAVTDLWRKNV
ncbi:MAG: histidinol-phosphate transaminase [Opitutales bacterium]|jgi:histidinol-phosphate aminotransferase